MSCFDNFIGVKGCGTATPKSGYYIQDLEGINITSAADFASNESGRELLERKILFAIKQTASDVIALMPNLNFNLYAESLQGYCFNQTTGSGQPSQTVIKSSFYAPLSELTANRVVIKLDQDAPGETLEITDGVNILDSFPVDITAGVEFVQEMSATSTTGKLIARLTGSYDYFNSPKTCLAWKSALSASCCSRPCESKYLEVTDGKGVVIDLSLSCSREKLICRLLHPLKDAVLYRSGVEILNEYLATDRVNFLAVHGKEWAAQKVQEWRAAFEQKINMALTSAALKSLQNVDDVCFDCGGNKFGYGL